MVKRTKQELTPKAKKTYLSLRMLFIIIWFVIVTLLVRSTLLPGVLEQLRLSADNLNLAIDIILLAPVAIATFPLAYRMNDIYSTDEKSISVPAWKRSIFGIVGTGTILGLILYLFMIINVTLFLNRL